LDHSLIVFEAESYSPHLASLYELTIHGEVCVLFQPVFEQLPFKTPLLPHLESRELLVGNQAVDREFIDVQIIRYFRDGQKLFRHRLYLPST
jgi:hypothetical protein